MSSTKTKAKQVCNNVLHGTKNCYPNLLPHSVLSTTFVVAICNMELLIYR